MKGVVLADARPGVPATHCVRAASVTDTDAKIPFPRSAKNGTFERQHPDLTETAEQRCAAALR